MELLYKNQKQFHGSTQNSNRELRFSRRHDYLTKHLYRTAFSSHQNASSLSTLMKKWITITSLHSRPDVYKRQFERREGGQSDKCSLTHSHNNSVCHILSLHNDNACLHAMSRQLCCSRSCKNTKYHVYG